MINGANTMELNYMDSGGNGSGVTRLTSPHTMAAHKSQLSTIGGSTHLPFNSAYRSVNPAPSSPTKSYAKESYPISSEMSMSMKQDQHIRWIYHINRNRTDERPPGKICSSNSRSNNSGSSSNGKAKLESAFTQRNKVTCVEKNNNNPSNINNNNKSNNINNNYINNNNSCNKNNNNNKRKMPSGEAEASSGIAPIGRAFRHIEDVHNYAKLNHYLYTNGGGNHGNANRTSASNSNSNGIATNSAPDEDEEEDDDNDDDEDDVDADDDDDDVDDDGDDDEPEVEVEMEQDDNVLSNAHQATMANYDRFFYKKRSPAIGTGLMESTKPEGGNKTESANIHADVDVETLDSVGETEAEVEARQCASGFEAASGAGAAPDHHARRPMNAFLIFCKRHRAIVKERYKTLENRAITKILGDWWASLDANEKKCFTNLAQQNKDAFFSANPNFKWYKLPAPPLRTLSTRPCNADRTGDRLASAAQEPELEESRCVRSSRKQSGNQHYFKLADEAQMGELSSLIEHKPSREAQPDAVRDCLQQTLSDTTDFLNTHLQALSPTQAGKRRPTISGGNSLSSASSEEDTLPQRKTSRSCKGKIYQELINSGQLAAAAKKPKILKSLPQHAQFGGEIQQQREGGLNRGHSPPGGALGIGRSGSFSHQKGHERASGMGKARAVSESERYELVHFDLDEKIKDLPALSLDTYLQKKRSTKKKKKFTARKRNSNSTSSSKNASAVLVTATAAGSTTSVTSLTSSPSTMDAASGNVPMPKAPLQSVNQSLAAVTAPIVGSQKRKARKESITRRDLSAIESEVASLFPLSSTTINGCYYFNEGAAVAGKPCPAAPQSTTTPTTTSDTAAPVAGTADATVRTPSTLASMTNAPLRNDVTTSYLLILAEVATNHTEQKQRAMNE